MTASTPPKFPLALSCPQAGWRLQCAACDRELVHWAPPRQGRYLPFPPVYEQPSLWGTEKASNWFIYRDRHNHAPLALVLCPEHRELGDDWVHRNRSWNNRRNSVGREKHQSWLDRLKTAIGLKPDPKKETAREMAEWMEKNPKPTPPWEMSELHVLAAEGAK